MRSLVAAFAMYSRIPMPKMQLTEENTRYSLCFFPVVGAVIGAVVWAAFRLMTDLAGFGMVFTGAVMAVLPVIITGGIHMDGFLDTSDAIHSWKDREERLRILKDPHVGAFAVISGIVYMLLLFAAWTEIRRETVGAVCIGYVLSRTLSGLSVVTFPKAAPEGMVHSAAKQAPGSVRFVLLTEMAAASAALALLYGTAGAVILALALAVFVYYHGMSRRRFGGITGDLAGYFLCLCELAVVMAAVLAGRLL